MNTRITSFAALLGSLLLTLSCAPAVAAYSVVRLGPITPDQSSYGELIGVDGLVIGESYVRQDCPMQQWVGCLVEGYTHHQPRSVWWSARTPGESGGPTPMRCLSKAGSTSASWDKPCEAQAVNSRGVLVGRSYVAKGAFDVGVHPVLWLSPGSEPLDLSPQMQGLPPYLSARAVGINEQGWILGRAQVDNKLTEYAFLLRDGLASVLPAAGALSVRARALNATMAVGEGRYERGGQSGVIVWTLGGPTSTLRTVDGTENDVHALGISSAGHVAGFYWAPASKQGNHAYVWFQGRAQALPTEAGYSSVAYGVNAAGQVVGSHCRTDQDIHGCRAVVWTNGVRQDVNALATPPAGFTFVQAKAINDRGQITGWMVNAANTYRGFALLPQP